MDIFDLLLRKFGKNFGLKQETLHQILCGEPVRTSIFYVSPNRLANCSAVGATADDYRSAREPKLAALS